MKFLFSSALAFFLVCFSCTASRVQVTQGLTGHVYYVAGNQMPSPDRKISQPKGMKTTIYVYELTNLGQVVRIDGSSFYSAVNSRFIADVESNEDGSFAISLPPGKYSLFTKKDTLFYANRFDEHNNILPVEVVKDAVTPVDIKVDYNAVY